MVSEEIEVRKSIWDDLSDDGHNIYKIIVTDCSTGVNVIHYTMSANSLEDAYYKAAVVFEDLKYATGVTRVNINKLSLIVRPYDIASDLT